MYLMSRFRVSQAMGFAVAVSLAIGCRAAEKAPDTASANRVSDSSTLKAQDTARAVASIEEAAEVIDTRGGGPGGPDSGSGSVKCPGVRSPGLKPLPKPIETISDADLCAYLNTLAYHPDIDDHERECSDPGCNASTFTYAGLRGVDPGSDAAGANIPQFGYVVARVQNHGPHKEKKYNLPHSKKSWWLVDKDASGNVRSRMFYRAQKPADRILKTASFHTCNQKHPPTNPVEHARWQKCPGAKPDEKKMASRHDTPAWITCALGCCIAGTTALDDAS